MKNFVQPGNVVPVTAPYTGSAGQGILVGSLFGVAAEDFTNGGTAQIVMEGVVEIAKTSALAISQGDAVYWDDTNKVVNKTTTGQMRVGNAIEAAVNPSPTVKIRLTGASLPLAT